jgi:hypothetical protein
MPRVVPAAERLAVGLAAATVLSLGVGGLAGAAAPAPSTTTPAPSSTASPTHQFNCARAPKVLARIQKAEAKIAAGLPKLHAAEAKATAAGRTKAANRIERRIDRLQNPKTAARLDRRTKNIESRCHVSAPASTSSTGGATTSSTSTST